MSLRVTQGMMHAQLLRNVNNNLHRMEQGQNELSTGRKLNKPSDDPVGITYALRYRSEISINEQYQKNVDNAQSQVDHTDSVLGQINGIIQRVNELTVQGVNGTNPQSALNAIAQEIGGLYEEAVSLGNDQLNGKYIFNGQMTDKQPYTAATASTDQTDTLVTSFKFAAGVTVPVNVTGNEVFGSPTDSDNLFKVVKGLENAFLAGNKAAAGSLMGDLTNRLNKFLDVRADIGARTNRIELIDQRVKDLDLNLNALSGKTEDADLSEVIMKLKMDENVYQASLSTGAKVIQPSLVDYLR